MEKWEEAVNAFIKPWKVKEYIQAAILTGSYATNNQNSKSDIDIYLVSYDYLKWRERGNQIINNYLIEYFINPPKQISKYMEDGIKNGNRVDASIFYTGKVLFDKTGILQILKKRAKTDMNKELNSPSKAEKENLKYFIWDFFEEIEWSYISHNDDYFYLYNMYLELILTSFCKYNKYVLPAKYKIYNYLIDKKIPQKYGIKSIPDKRFTNQFISCIKEKDINESFTKIKKLKEYVLRKIGGFEINGWKLRTKLEL
jgi:hypothetical protein